MFIKFLILGSLYFYFSLMGFCSTEDILNDIEYSKYGTTFSSESLGERLSRLETDSFGMAQSGDIDSRINMLKRVSNSGRTSAILPSVIDSQGVKKKSAIRRLFDNFSNNGIMTGFTPNISGYDYANGYYRESYGNSYPSNNMIRNTFNNFLNNNGQYCPYHNRYHGNGNFLTKPYHNINRYHNHWNPHYQNSPRFNNSHNFHYRPKYGIHRPQMYIPPNVQSRSSVTILRD